MEENDVDVETMAGDNDVGDQEADGTEQHPYSVDSDLDDTHSDLSIEMSQSTPYASVSLLSQTVLTPSISRSTLSQSAQSTFDMSQPDTDWPVSVSSSDSVASVTSTPLILAAADALIGQIGKDLKVVWGEVLVKGLLPRNVNRNGNSANFFSYVCYGRKIKELFASTLIGIPISVRCVSSMIVFINAKSADYLLRTQTRNTVRNEEARQFC